MHKWLINITCLMKFLDYVKSVVINTIIVDKHKYDVIHPFIL